MTIPGVPSTDDDLRAVYVNCTLKRSPATSHTQYLLDHSATIVERAGASVTHIRAVDHDIAFGTSPDMSEVDRNDGVVVTGNEDGVKHCAANICYALAHIGYTIPPQPDCGWIGEIGPGPSYGDPVEGSRVPLGFDHEFTMKNTTFMTWNLLHTARMLKDAGGVPAFGNVAAAWKAGERWGYPDPSR